MGGAATPLPELELLLLELLLLELLLLELLLLELLLLELLLLELLLLELLLLELLLLEPLLLEPPELLELLAPGFPLPPDELVELLLEELELLELDELLEELELEPPPPPPPPQAVRLNRKSTARKALQTDAFFILLPFCFRINKSNSMSAFSIRDTLRPTAECLPPVRAAKPMKSLYSPKNPETLYIKRRKPVIDAGQIIGKYPRLTQVRFWHKKEEESHRKMTRRKS